MSITNSPLPSFHPSFTELRHRPVPPPSSSAEIRRSITHGTDFQKVSKLLCPSQGLFALVDNLAELFYSKDKFDTFKLLHKCIERGKPVLPLLKKCYSFLTHCPSDVEQISNPEEICDIFQNVFWMATFAIHLGGSLKFSYGDDEGLKAFRFPNLKTLPHQHYAAVTLYWDREIYSGHDRFCY